MMAKPKKTLELHYPMIQFLIMDIRAGFTTYFTRFGRYIMGGGEFSETSHPSLDKKGHLACSQNGEVVFKYDFQSILLMLSTPMFGSLTRWNTNQCYSSVANRLPYL